MFGRESLRINRSESVNSVQSEQSLHGDETTQPEMDQSLDLLANVENEAETAQGNQPLAPGLISEELLRRAMKRVMEPMIFEMKRVKVECAVLDKKMSQVLTQNETLHKLVKELKAELNKGCDDLQVLLTGEGVQFLKQMCVGNLDMKAKEESETDLLQKFMDKAKEEGWMIKKSQKAEKDIVSKYRDNRNYLKAQIRIRVAEDLATNVTPISSSQLSKTIKFIREHLSVVELSNDILLVLYNYAYSALKYHNKEIGEETMTEAEKKIKKKVEQNIWVYAMNRVEQDRKSNKDAMAIKDKILRMLQSGVKYVSS